MNKDEAREAARFELTDKAIQAMDEAITETLGLERTLRQNVADQRRADDIAFGFERGYASGREAASVDRVAVGKSVVLTLIRAAKTENWTMFASYARFAAEKTGDEYFIKSVDKYLGGEYGATIHLAEIGGDDEQV